jgi:DNA-directed RNA polymerase subunit M/transcription elongation factor TFIIS
MTSEEELYQCAGCGEAIAAEPPDEFYTKPSRTKPTKKKSDSGNVIAVDYDCPSCGVTNAIYWERPEG